MMDSNDALVVFQSRKIRRVLHEKEWFFSVVDVVKVLTESTDAKDYWYRLKKRELESSKVELSTFCRQLKLESADGKKYSTDCANTQSLFRIIQSIPSPKAEPFKQWLAKVGYERWKKRNVKTSREYAILTAEISKETFGMTPTEYKKFKKLKNENLRDHMDDLELIFSMLGERVTTEITRNKNTKGFTDCENAAKKGGKVAGNARKDAEKQIGKPISKKENYKHLTGKKKGELN